MSIIVLYTWSYQKQNTEFVPNSFIEACKADDFFSSSVYSTSLFSLLSSYYDYDS